MNDHMTHFAGKQVIDWQSGEPLPDLSTAIPRISGEDGINEHNSLDEEIQELSDHPDAKAITGLVTGFDFRSYDCEEPYLDAIVSQLLERREQFPHLTALFLGDITFEESEISWIRLGEISSLFPAYPQLEHVGIRGCASNYAAPHQFHLGILHHKHLKTLIIETGSMDRSVVHDVLRSHLPALEHLELWLGSANYEANCTIEDFAPLFTDKLFPNLRYLGLRNSEITNDLVNALSQSPLLEQLQVLDLSLGTLDDTGAATLLNCPAILTLEKLDLHHHFCSEEMVKRLEALPIQVDASERTTDGHRDPFVAISE